MRWVLSDGDSSGPGGDGRVGASRVLAAVERSCTPVSLDTTSSTATTATLYDCRGRASALAAASR